MKAIQAGRGCRRYQYKGTQQQVKQPPRSKTKTGTEPGTDKKIHLEQKETSSFTVAQRIGDTEKGKAHKRAPVRTEAGHRGIRTWKGPCY